METLVSEDNSFQQDEQSHQVKPYRLVVQSPQSMSPYVLCNVRLAPSRHLPLRAHTHHPLCLALRRATNSRARPLARHVDGPHWSILSAEKKRRELSRC